jgi:uncharacterized membrane protein YbhN (UPF0104 family)
MIIVPAGLGIRESVIALLLARLGSESAAVSVALLARLSWLLVEGLCIAVSLWLIGGPSEWRGAPGIEKEK